MQTRTVQKSKRGIKKSNLEYPENTIINITVSISISNNNLKYNQTPRNTKNILIFLRCKELKMSRQYFSGPFAYLCEIYQIL